MSGKVGNQALNAIEVVILTSDYRLVSRLMEEGRRRGLKMVHTADSDGIPLTAKVLVTRRGEAAVTDIGVPTVYADEYASVKSLVDRVVEVAAGRWGGGKIIISIDPGRTTGVAFMVGDLLVRTESFTELSDLEKCIREFVSNRRGIATEVLVGSGAPQYRDRVLEMIRRMPELAGTRLEIVPEEGTSKMGLSRRGRRGKDEYAAAILSVRRRHVKLGT
ncbi:MAG: hypothetical protein QXI97_03220 [Nitrososphaerota archaeon]